MKTSLENPDALFRKVKATAAERGQSLKDFVTGAVRDRLAAGAAAEAAGPPAWMEGFGALKRLRKETARVQARIDQEFEAIEAEDRA